MTVLVTGATGMLGTAVMNELRQRRITAVSLARSGTDFNVDMTCDDALTRAMAEIRPSMVINTAALTDVGMCESDPLAAWRINGRAVAVLADLCRKSGIRLVHVSTDHFFAGDGDARHDENADVCLLNDYARTKFAGESFALACPGALAVRINIVGLRRRGNHSFAEWAFDLIERDGEATLFDDFFVSSLDVPSCANALLNLVDRNASGLINLACREVFSKKTFVEALAKGLGRTLTRTKTGTVARLAVGRADSLGLDVTKAENILGYRLPDLAGVVQALIAEYRGTA